METLETVGNGAGNTSTAPARSVPGKAWCFTAFANEMETLETQIKGLKNCRYGFGRETCPTTGREHSQGFITTENKIRPVEYFKTKKVHWEKMKGSIEQNVEYCKKDGSYTSNIKFKKTIINPMDGLELKDWQIDITQILDGPVDTRKIYVFVDPVGGAGKSTFCKGLVMTRDAISVCGKSADVKYAISEMIASDKDVDIVLWDLPRSIGNMVNYQAIEEVKNGMFFSTKYESGMTIFNQPHIIIFTNSEPDVTKLSNDRWCIRRIS